MIVLGIVFWILFFDYETKRLVRLDYWLWDLMLMTWV